MALYFPERKSFLFQLCVLTAKLTGCHSVAETRLMCCNYSMCVLHLLQSNALGQLTNKEFDW